MSSKPPMQPSDFPISRLCFEGPEEDLKLTENTQPALLTVAVAAYKVLEENGLRPDYVAGHSLGEYAALVAAGALDFADAVRLVRKRGQYMQEAVPPGVGAMAAILKLPQEKLEAVLAEAAQGEVVTAANFNSPDQIVIAGHTRCGPARQRSRESSRCQTRRSPAGQRTLSLSADETGSGSDGRRTRRRFVLRSAISSH